MKYFHGAKLAKTYDKCNRLRANSSTQDKSGGKVSEPLRHTTRRDAVSFFLQSSSLAPKRICNGIALDISCNVVNAVSSGKLSRNLIIRIGAGKMFSLAVKHGYYIKLRSRLECHRDRDAIESAAPRCVHKLGVSGDFVKGK